MSGQSCRHVADLATGQAATPHALLDPGLLPLPLMQVKTGVDYSHGNWFSTFLCGALNYQVVHHLFPSISQVMCRPSVSLRWALLSCPHPSLLSLGCTRSPHLVTI